MITVQDTGIDIAFNQETKLQSLITGSDLDFTGYIINSEGEIIHESTFDFESVFPPNAEVFLEAYLLSVEENIYIYKAIAVVEQNNKELKNSND